MNVGRTLLSWASAALWFVGGLLLIAGGYFIEVHVALGIMSLAIALLVAAVPVRAIASLSFGLATAFAVIVVLLGLSGPSVLALGAGLIYAAAAFFSYGAHRYEAQPGGSAS